jgi:immune inhibitor A
MKKLFVLTLVLTLLGIFNAVADPAVSDPYKVVQPDGSYVTICLHGDEFLNFTTTSDGYTVVKRPDGFYAYAELVGGNLVPTKFVAHDAVARTAAEKSFLYGVTKFVHPSVINSEKVRRMKSFNVKPTSAKPKKIDYSKFRGLIILANFNDQQFAPADTHEFFDSMANYSGFRGTRHLVDTVYNHYTGDYSFSGSIKDYYSDNSLGVFKPNFDVVGPVNINYSCHYANGANNGRELVKAACEAADPMVNFADYDLNNDSTVDMVYVIFAGLTSNFPGNDSTLLWAHSWNLNGLKVVLDNTKLGRYACSCEIVGSPQFNLVDGIGVICHEFGHVLGLPDLYDTDYSGSGGQSDDPANWLLMSGGDHQHFDRVPVALGSYERYALGFTSPKLISSKGACTLNPISTSNECYRINSQQDSVYFLLENRQKTGWDAYAPGHGLLAFRVDSTDVNLWEDNSLNCDPAHNHFVLLRVSKTYYNNRIEAAQTDPFPGSNGATSITNSTTPNLRTWSGLDSKLGLSGIAENNGVITFNVDELTTAVTAVKASPSSFTAVRSGNVLTVATSDSSLPVSLYRADGVLLNSIKVVGSADFTLPFHGLFIVNQGNVSQKVMY